jgi:hypothetical protein
MARNALNGVYFLNGDLTKIVYLVVENDKGLNFICDCSLFSTPRKGDKLISPATIVEWSK